MNMDQKVDLILGELQGLRVDVKEIKEDMYVQLKWRWSALAPHL